MNGAATAPSRCEHCGRSFEVPKSQVGGIANCPQCGKATTLEGLSDPIWRLAQFGAAIATIGIVVALVPVLGPVWAVTAGTVFWALLWLLSRSL